LDDVSVMENGRERDVVRKRVRVVLPLLRRPTAWGWVMHRFFCWIGWHDWVKTIHHDDERGNDYFTTWCLWCRKDA